MPTGGTNTAGIVIGIVVGLFVLVAVMGILAAIAIPNMLTAMQRSRQKRTMADMRSVAVAVEAYATDNNQYPHVNSIAELTPLLAPKYIKSIPVKDGWTTDLRYECWPEEKCQEYAFGSAGADKKFEQGSLREYSHGETQSFDCDIVFSNGAFVQYPERINEPSGGSR